MFECIINNVNLSKEMTMNLKTFEKQANFRPFVHPESPVARENNINEDKNK